MTFYEKFDAYLKEKEKNQDISENCTAKILICISIKRQLASDCKTTMSLVMKFNNENLSSFLQGEFFPKIVNKFGMFFFMKFETPNKMFK